MVWFAPFVLLSFVKLSYDVCMCVSTRMLLFYLSCLFGSFESLLFYVHFKKKKKTVVEEL